ncbi:MAG: Pr6Pr family membrane protein [Acidimicrobiia bacterium]
MGPRVAFGGLAVLVVVGFCFQVPVVVDARGGHFPTVGGRLFNLFCYFTILSNVLVGITCGLLAARPDRSGRVFAAVRLAAIVDITVTGIVYHLALADLDRLEGAAQAANLIFHMFVPILAVATWLLWGPRGLVGRDAILGATLIGLAWVAFTLVRGPLVRDYYPYPFIDVAAHGYGRVLLNVALVGLLFLLLAAGGSWLDERLPGARPGSVAVAGGPTG